MFFQTASYTDQGDTRPSNQDSYTVKIAHTAWGEIALAVICDGMGGLSQGEIASAALVTAFDKWICRELPQLMRQGLSEPLLAAQWNGLVQRTDAAIRRYGGEQDIRLGTTVTALLIAQERYYLMHVGDCRAYRIAGGEVALLTQDQTLAARELRAGHITEEAYRTDSRRNVLLQCVGAGSSVIPELTSAPCEGESVFLLCSDGFYHTLELKELAYLEQGQAREDWLRQYLAVLGRLCRQRGEQDNLTALALSCCQPSCGPTLLMETEQTEPVWQVLLDETQIHTRQIL